MPRLEVYFCSEYDHIGQMKRTDAPKEVERMKLKTGVDWKIVDTEVFIEIEEYSGIEINRIETDKDNVWVVQS